MLNSYSEPNRFSLIYCYFITYFQYSVNKILPGPDHELETLKSNATSIHGRFKFFRYWFQILLGPWHIITDSLIWEHFITWFVVAFKFSDQHLKIEATKNIGQLVESKTSLKCPLITSCFDISEFKPRNTCRLEGLRI